MNKTGGQTELVFRQWGGRRRGAGRKPKPKGQRLVPHLRRELTAKRFPVHVTLRLTAWNLRSGRCFRALQKAFEGARERFGMRLCEFSVMGNHVHLLVETEERGSLARGMKGLGVRAAKALNRVMRRKGRVYADRYHARILRTPTEVARAMNYVLNNARKHGLHSAPGADPRSSADGHAAALCIAQPQSWLLTRGLRRTRVRPLVT